MTIPLRPWDAPELTSWRRLPMHALDHSRGCTGVECIELDGTWRFELFPTPDPAVAAPAGQLRAAVEVPGCWTMQQFDDVHQVGDHPHYTNVQMPWPDLPPHPPADNPTGVYERDVELPAGWAGRRVVLHVGAAESVLLAQVNGIDVGISKDSHLAAEFDVTAAVRPGAANTLRLVVVKWSDASFIEDQDQWWHGGITRSVRLYATGPVYLADVRASALLQPGGLTGRLRLDVDVATAGTPLPAGWSVSVHPAAGGPLPDLVVAVPASAAAGPEVDEAGPPELVLGGMLRHRLAAGMSLPADQVEIAGAERERQGPHPTGRVVLDASVPGVLAWTAETPQLYPLTVRLTDPDSTVVEEATLRVGFRSVEIAGRDLLVNGVRVFLRGVNRHDVDARTGRVVTAAGIRADLELVKRFGFNAVRTSHYPNDPVLLDLADELGVYVVAEADIECHAYPHLADEPAYLGAFVDRVSRMVLRDAGHPSVIIWSLGNESGYGANHDAAAGWVRRHDPSRPLQYEGAIKDDWCTPQPASDVVCPMYAPIDAILAHATSGRQTRPLILCEYSHAMGNSNGTLAEYWEAIESTPGLQGGFIWELRDHGLRQRLPDGRVRWAYGGDFGDEPNDGTFVTDGLLFSDGSPKPALWEHARLASPVRIGVLTASLSTGVVEVAVRNRQDFRDLSGYRLGWRLTVHGDADGKDVTREAEVQSVDVPARGAVTVTLPGDLVDGLPAGGEAWLTLTVARADTGQRDTGQRDTGQRDTGQRGTGRRGTGRRDTGSGDTDVVAWDQVQLRADPRSLRARAGASRGDGPPAATLADAGVGVDEAGLLTHPLLVAAPRLALWRAPTDNDVLGGMARSWAERGLDRLTRSLLGLERDGEQVEVSSEFRTGDGTAVRHRQRLTPVRAAGGRVAVLVEEEAEVPGTLTDLARVGTRFEVAPGVDRVTWLGEVRYETYPDRRFGAAVERLDADVADLFTPYLRPQESGGRHGVRWFTLAGADGAGPALTVHLDRPRQVNLAHYRPEDLAAATHHDELVPRPEVVVHLDAAHRGVGTASCGPDTLSGYLVGAGTYRWSWVLQPVG